jgi:PPK2 family polyphosphate:nucleotide phosphotransferase
MSKVKIDATPFRLAEGATVLLGKRPTLIDPFYKSKSDYQAILAEHVEALSRLQEHLYRSGRYALLIVLQGMDTAGKDGAIRHVMSGVNPQGCRVVAFKAPTPAESAHDFLWRTVRELPERGIIGAFNRSYYESVLITRVHPELLRQEGDFSAHGDLEDLWAQRLRSIRGLERHLCANGTRLVKIFLHLSKEEQLRRLLDRLDTPEKSWKASHSDAEERRHWKDYVRAYEDALAKTSLEAAPWWVVPADDKLNARLIVSQIVIDALADLKLSPPPIDDDRRRELQAIRKMLEK